MRYPARAASGREQLCLTATPAPAAADPVGSYLLKAAETRTALRAQPHLKPGGTFLVSRSQIVPVGPSRSWGPGRSDLGLRVGSAGRGLTPRSVLSLPSGLALPRWVMARWVEDLSCPHIPLPPGRNETPARILPGPGLPDDPSQWEKSWDC